MLSVAEREKRWRFYVDKLGKSKLSKIVARRSHLWPITAYNAKITGLAERGFKDPQKVITSWPVILGYSFDNIDAKIAGLAERGFKDPQKMLTSWPNIFGLSFDNIDAKIAGLAERGFDDPQRMIASRPAILGYSFDNIDAKIAGLAERGFKDPQRMIVSFPDILGLSFDNIDRKLRLCRRLGVNIEAFMSYTVVFIGMSWKHYVPILRKCKELAKEPNPKNVFAIYRAKTF